MLTIGDVSKKYRRGPLANDRISMRVSAGEVLGLFGHNGAGKTTLINQVAGLVRPDAGTIRLDGHDLVADPAHARRVCSLMPQAQAPLTGVTPRQAIEIMARIRGADRARARARTGQLLAALDIEAWAGSPGEKLSGGLRRLTAFCMAAAEPGRLLMFDEPTNDVDPVRRRLLWTEVRRLADAGSGVLIVTHNMAEAERVIDRLVVLDHGRVVAEGTPHELRGDQRDLLRLDVLAAPDSQAQVASELGLVEAPGMHGRRLTATIPTAEAGPALAAVQRLRDEGRVEEFSLTPVGLDDVYAQLLETEASVDA